MNTQVDCSRRLDIVYETERRSLGQVAFEADRENAIRENHGVERLIPTWHDAPPSVKRNWDVLALRIAEALSREAAPEIEMMRGKVVEVTVESNVL